VNEVYHCENQITESKLVAIPNLWKEETQAFSFSAITVLLQTLFYDAHTIHDAVKLQTQIIVVAYRSIYYTLLDVVLEYD
jgi:hypothetical protein